MRKLATIQKIKKILPIEGADSIELAIVNGWQVVIGKSENHKVGDLVVYCEIDSFLPEEPEFEFLRKNSYKKMADGNSGFRLRTIKLRGEISQGLIISVEKAYAIFKRHTPNMHMSWFEGLEVTDMLNIIKYDPPVPACLAGVAKGNFPGFIPKTDEERVQNLVDKYETWKEKEIGFYASEKLDGGSATFYNMNNEFGVCSRNLELIETDDNTIWKVARELDLPGKLSAMEKNIALQGELIGEGIQGNPYKIKGQKVRFFNIFDIDKHERYDFFKFIKTIAELKLESVPILEMNFKLPDTIGELLKLAESKSALNNKTEREGIVIRSTDGSISFKAISNKFLINEQ